MTDLTTKELRDLKARAHHLKPVVTVADKGITENIKAAVDEALEVHELIKVRVRGADRDSRTAIMDELVSLSGAAKIGAIGGIVILYRKSETNDG